MNDVNAVFERIEATEEDRLKHEIRVLTIERDYWKEKSEKLSYQLDYLKGEKWR